jgi:hypothetical protein
MSYLTENNGGVRTAAWSYQPEKWNRTSVTPNFRFEMGIGILNFMYEISLCLWQIDLLGNVTGMVNLEIC